MCRQKSLCLFLAVMMLFCVIASGGCGGSGGEMQEGMPNQETTSPDNPTTPETPTNPETPDTHEAPDTPETPNTPNTPEIPDTPPTPDIPQNEIVSGLNGTWNVVSYSADMTFDGQTYHYFISQPKVTIRSFTISVSANPSKEGYYNIILSGDAVQDTKERFSEGDTIHDPSKFDTESLTKFGGVYYLFVGSMRAEGTISGTDSAQKESDNVYKSATIYDEAGNSGSWAYVVVDDSTVLYTQEADTNDELYGIVHIIYSITLKRVR